MKTLDIMFSVVVYSLAAINLVLTPAFLLGPYLLPLSAQVALKDHGIHFSEWSLGFDLAFGSLVVLMSVGSSMMYSSRRQVMAGCLEHMGKLRTYTCVGIMCVTVPVVMLGGVLEFTLSSIFLGHIEGMPLEQRWQAWMEILR